MLVLRQWTVYVNEQFTSVGVHVKLFPFTLVGLIQQRPDASVPLYGYKYLCPFIKNCVVNYDFRGSNSGPQHRVKGRKQRHPFGTRYSLNG